jgi:hypothetical protein
MDKITIERQTLERAVTALVYHQQQTRPIERTQIAIRELRAALAAQPADPVAWQWRYIDPDEGPSIWVACEKPDAVAYGENSRYEVRPLYAAQPAPAAVPSGYALVPVEFVQGFNTMAHNYCLRAEPPDYYSGTEADAFRHAYSRCGSDLRKLRDMLAAGDKP